MQNNNEKQGLSWSSPSQPAKPAAPVTNGSHAPASPAAQKPLQKSLPAAASSPSNTAAYVGVLVGGIIVGILVAWGYSAATNRPQTSTVASTSQMASNDQAPASSDSNAATGETVSDLVTLPSPQKAGFSVAVDKATITGPTWVVVYDDVAGKPGNVLGASLIFSTGPASITLLRATQPGITYFLGLSPDNGDHKFAKATDHAVLAPDGSVALATFVAN